MDRPEAEVDAPHPPSGHGARPFPLSPSLTWFELFYDLVFVASVIIFSNAVSRHPTWNVTIGLAGVFAIVWFVWLLTVLLVNLFHRDDPAQRALVLFQMFLVTLVAVAVGDGFSTHTGWAGPLVGALLAVTALMYARPPSRNDDVDAESRTLQFRVAAMCLAAAVVFTATGFLGGSAVFVLWVVGGAVAVVPSLVLLSRSSTSGPSIEAEHLIERLGAFTILVCGESFVKVGLAATDGTLDGIDLWVMAFEFILVFSVWWAYFDDIPRAGMPLVGTRRAGWAVAHLPLHLALVGVAIGASKFIVAAAAQDIAIYKLVLITLPLAGVYLSLGVIGWLSPRPVPRGVTSIRVGTALVILVISAVWWNTEQGTAEALFGIFALLALANAWVVSTWLARDHSLGADTSSPTAA